MGIKEASLIEGSVDEEVHFVKAGPVIQKKSCGTLKWQESLCRRERVVDRIVDICSSIERTKLLL